ncbi:Uncharacterised protein [uncultured archaeon]|nr:Uncharacterised protein [uncultured archaeon]
MITKETHVTKKICLPRSYRAKAEFFRSIFDKHKCRWMDNDKNQKAGIEYIRDNVDENSLACLKTMRQAKYLDNGELLLLHKAGWDLIPIIADIISFGLISCWSDTLAPRTLKTASWLSDYHVYPLNKKIFQPVKIGYPRILKYGRDVVWVVNENDDYSLRHFYGKITKEDLRWVRDQDNLVLDAEEFNGKKYTALYYQAQYNRATFLLKEMKRPKEMLGLVLERLDRMKKKHKEKQEKELKSFFRAKKKEHDENAE